jgi:hypothetical protein
LPKNPNKSRNETVEYAKPLEYKKPIINCTIKRFEKQENAKRGIGSGPKCALSSFKRVNWTKFPAKIFFKFSLAVKKELYIYKCLPLLLEFIWPDLAFAHYKIRWPD